MVHQLDSALVTRWDPDIIVSDRVTPDAQIDILGYRGPSKFVAPAIRFGDPAPALVSGRHFAVWTEAAGLDQESLYLSQYGFADMFAPGRVIRQLPDRPILVAANAVHWNHWHWIFQCLAPAALAKAEGLSTAFLFPALGKVARESLAMADIDPADIIELDDNEIAAVPQAVITNLTTGEHAFLPHPAIVPVLEAIADRVPQSPLAGRKIYVERDSSRRVMTNEAELIAALEERGFLTIRASQFSLAEQMAMFRDAATIISGHGAALSNLAFSRGPDGPVVIELAQENYLNQIFLKLAQVKRLPYSIIVSRMVDPGEDGRHHSTWEADIPLILASVACL